MSPVANLWFVWNKKCWPFDLTLYLVSWNLSSWSFKLISKYYRCTVVWYIKDEFITNLKGCGLWALQTLQVQTSFFMHLHSVCHLEPRLFHTCIYNFHKLVQSRQHKRWINNFNKACSMQFLYLLCFCISFELLFAVHLYLLCTCICTCLAENRNCLPFVEQRD